MLFYLKSIIHHLMVGIMLLSKYFIPRLYFFPSKFIFVIVFLNYFTTDIIIQCNKYNRFGVNTASNI